MIRWIGGCWSGLGWLVGAGHGAELNAHDPLARVGKLLKGPVGHTGDEQGCRIGSEA